jgi:hypothetical protein
MRRHRVASLALIFLLAASAPGRAGTIFTADITHSQETVQGPLLTSAGEPRPLSFGTAVFTLNDAQTELSFTATIFNIDVTRGQTPDKFDDLVAAHIHVGAAPGSNAPVRWGFFGVPDNDSNPDSLVVTPFASGVGGTFSSIWDLPEGNGGTTLTSNLPEIIAGLSYINFHTVQYAGGEIRGQILLVPEPGSAVQLGAGIAGLCAYCRRRVRRAA